MDSWHTIRARAVARHGEEALEARAPWVATDAELRAQGDDRYLAAMSQRVFAAGFQWRVIQAKWDGFEAAFAGFDPGAVAVMGEELDRLLADPGIVRNRAKILATIENAAFVQRIRQEHGSFGAWLAAWPREDTLGLWDALKKGGSRLGGDTGSWFLRQVGKDTFRFSEDVGHALVESGVIDAPPTTKARQRAAQRAMVAWADEAGTTLAAVSVTLAMSTGKVYEGR